jgi:hypothetical protein
MCGHVGSCPGFHDYIALVNSRGGVDGHRIKALEIDHEYKVPPAVESYERFKREGVVSVAVYGTPHIYALTKNPPPGVEMGAQVLDFMASPLQAETGKA